jgi:hypothetical protein
LARWRTRDGDTDTTRDGTVEDVPESRLSVGIQMDGPGHAGATVGVQLEVGRHRQGCGDIPPIKSELQPARWATSRALHDGLGDDRLPFRRNPMLGYANHIDVALSGYVSAQRDRSHEVGADEAAIERIRQSPGQLPTEQINVTRDHIHNLP